jgi:hypothetical protein
VRTTRVVLGLLGLLALLLLGLTAFHLFRPVSATAVAGGPTWPCGSVAKPALPASYGIAAGTPDEGRQAFVLDEVACSAARDRQLALAVRALLPMLGLAAVLVGTSAARSPRKEPAFGVAA